MTNRTAKSVHNAVQTACFCAALTFASFVLGPTVGFCQTASAAVDAFIHGHMKQRRIPGLALAVIQDSVTVKLSAYGVTNILTGTPVTPETPFEVASVTKNVTAVGIMALVEDGVFGLDDEIGQHLDDIPSQWKRVTVRQLLTHTSGLPDLLLDPFSSFTIAETSEAAMALLADRPLEFEPGEEWRYNQTNYMVLAVLIQHHSGLSYQDFITKRMFLPLGVRSTAFGKTEVGATVYTVFDFSGGEPQIMDGIEPLHQSVAPVLFPAGGLNISVADFAEWLMALLDQQLISKSSLKKLWTSTHLNDGSVFRLKRPTDFKQWTTYGLGWILKPDASPQWTGGAGGVRTAFLVYPDQDLAVIVFTNLQGAGPEAIATAVAQHYLSG